MGGGGEEKMELEKLTLGAAGGEDMSCAGAGVRSVL